MKKGTELGKEAESIMKEGKLVPTEVTVKLLRAAIDKSSNDKFLIDGFPREVHQAEAFEKEVSPPQLVIFYDCPEVLSHLPPISITQVLWIVLQGSWPLPSRTSNQQSRCFSIND